MRIYLLSIIWLLVVGCNEVCDEGQSCARECPEHAWGVCTENGMCRCQDFLEVVQEEKYLAMSACNHPAPGDLLINELLIDGEPTEAQEFLEVVNTSAQYIRLDGVSVFVRRGHEMSERLALDLGCIAPRGVLLLGANSPEPTLEPPWTYEASYRLRRFGFSNSSDFIAELRLFGVTVIDRVELPHARFRAGVSLVRSPDISGTGFLDHRLEGQGRRSSPGLCSDGSAITTRCPRVEQRCLPPRPNWLVINEIMADAEPESREYVELANNTDKPMDLSGLRLIVQRGDATSTKLELWSGCLMPGELVAFYSNHSEALGRDRLLSGLVFDAYRFRFSNSSDTRLILMDRNGASIDRFLVKAAEIEESTSVNRFPDISGGDIVRHDRVYDARSSPGLRARTPHRQSEMSDM